MEYSYANTDLLEFPQKYQMTPFEGREFLSSYEKNRQKILDKIKNNQTVNSLSHTLKLLQKQFLIDNGANAFPLIRQPIIADITLPLLPTNNGIVTGF